MSNCVAYFVADGTPAAKLFKKGRNLPLRLGAVWFVSPEELESLREDVVTIPLQEVQVESLPTVQHVVQHDLG